MDEYEKKLKELRTYVPFLTKMIDKLEKAGDKSKEAQLAKMKSLKGILTAPDKKLRLDTLNKCEDVLHKLYEKVEGPPPVSSTTVSVSGMFYKHWLIRNSKIRLVKSKKSNKTKVWIL